MKYKILTAANAPALEKLVNEAIEEGMHPSGEVRIIRVLVPGTPGVDQHIDTLWVQVVREGALPGVTKAKK